MPPVSNSLFASASAGMRAASTALQVSANNVANANSRGYVRQEAVQTASSTAGVSTSVRPAAQQGADLESDVVNQLQAKNAFMANLAVFKTACSLSGTLLDQKA